MATKAEEYLEQVNQEDEFLSDWNVVVEEAKDGRYQFTIPHSNQLTLHSSLPKLGGSIHAGVLSTIIDMGTGALRTEVDKPSDLTIATTDLNISYLRPATDDLFVESDVTRIGTSVGVVDVTIESTSPDGERKKVAVGRATAYLEQ